MPGVRSQDHAIIWMVQKDGRDRKATTPPPMVEGEAYLQRRPIKIIAASKRDKLHPASRINYAKSYTVEHNSKVCFIGDIAKECLSQFKATFKEVILDAAADGGVIEEEEVPANAGDVTGAEEVPEDDGYVTEAREIPRDTQLKKGKSKSTA
jgi:hypothetical protein